MPRFPSKYFRRVPALIFFPALALLRPPAASGAETPGERSDALRLRALSGDAEAQLELAQEFFYGRNRRKNPTLARYYFKQAADRGSVEGLFNLAVCWEQGFGGEKNLPLAFSLYRKAAEKGLAAAEFQAGRFLLIGVPEHRGGERDYPGVEADREKAVRYLRSAAAKNFAPAANELALLEIAGDGGEPPPPGSDAAEAARKKAAAAMEYLFLHLPPTDGRGWRKLADAFYAGKGGKREPERMFECLKRAASAGDPEGMAKLAYAYQYGDGTAPDMAQAFAYFSRSAEAGHPGAVAKMGEYYLTGDFVKMDLVEARRRFEAASKSGSPAGLYQYGRCLLYGWGGERSESTGLEYLLEAAKAGEIRAQKLLAGFYREGKFVPKDLSGAAFWYKKAALSGDAEAMRLFALALEKGEGVKRDAAAAGKFLEQAAAMGDVPAAALLGLPGAPGVEKTEILLHSPGGGGTGK